MKASLEIAPPIRVSKSDECLGLQAGITKSDECPGHQAGYHPIPKLISVASSFKG